MVCFPSVSTAIRSCGVQILYFVVLFGKKRIELFKAQIWRADINMCIESWGCDPTLLFYYFRIHCWHYEGSVWLG